MTAADHHVQASSGRVPFEVAEGVDLSVLVANPDGPLAPVLLVHGLASNARMWDGVASVLAEAGHPVAAVDQRGHGLSSKPDDGYDFATVTADLRRLLQQLGWEGRRPVVAGQSWGGNVVLELAARHPGVVGSLVLVDGGTIDLSGRFADWPTAEAALAPPALAGIEWGDFERLTRARHPDWPEAGIAGALANVERLEDGTIRPWLSRERHMRILSHLWDQHPADIYPKVRVPVLLLMADDGSDARWVSTKRHEVAVAGASLARSSVRWVRGDHDLHAQHPDLVAGLIRQVTSRPA